MQKLHERANKLTQKGQKIADEIFKYSPEANGDKMSVRDIQHLAALLARYYAELYGNLEEELE